MTVFLVVITMSVWIHCVFKHTIKNSTSISGISSAIRVFRFYVGVNIQDKQPPQEQPPKEQPPQEQSPHFYCKATN